MSRLRLLFVTDLHGATAVFRKAIRFAEKYKIKNVILGGDIAGKVLIPVREISGKYSVNVKGLIKFESDSESEVINKLSTFADKGFYYEFFGEKEYEEIMTDEDKLSKIMLRKMIERVEEWVDMAKNAHRKNGIKFYMMAGNDDPLELVDTLEKMQGDGVIHSDLKIVNLEEGIELLSCGYSNMTPWSLPRDLPDEELEKILYDLAGNLEKPDKSIFNIHAPPYGTNIDYAPLLDEDMRPVLKPGGGYEMVNVGSKAVRKLIEDYQPILSLHGHIHESRGFHKIGKTLALNPGSEYQEGFLRAAVVVLNPDKMKVEDFVLIQV